MRRRIGLSLVLGVGLLVTLGMAPVMLARQGADDPEWSDITVTCGDRETPCDIVDGYQTYIAVLEADVNAEGTPTIAEYTPLTTFDFTMAVRVREGTLAFRAPQLDENQIGDVVVEPAPDSNGIQLLIATQNDPATPTVVPFDQPVSAMNPAPDYKPNGFMDLAQCSSESGDTLKRLCILKPELFAGGMGFVQLVQGDTVYLTSGSSCFFCNIGSSDAVLEVWAPGGGNIWAELGQRGLLGPAPTRLQDGELRAVRGWMLNPGSPCH